MKIDLYLTTKASKELEEQVERELSQKDRSLSSCEVAASGSPR